ncbi:MAG: hypothetical protein ABSA11_03410 [Candidatus Bathyarchaeia archaeon]
MRHEPSTMAQTVSFGTGLEGISISVEPMMRQPKPSAERGVLSSTK